MASGYPEPLPLYPLNKGRANELSGLCWEGVDFHWKSLTIKERVEGLRPILLTPYVAALLAARLRRNAWVFSSPTAADGTGAPVF